MTNQPMTREQLREERMKKREAPKPQITRHLTPAAQARRAEESKSLVNRAALSNSVLASEVPDRKKLVARVQPPAPKVDPNAVPDVSKLARAVEENMKSLSVLMNDELHFLEQQDMAGLLALREEKAKLVREYQEHMAIIIRRPALLKEAPDDVRARLKLSGQTLSEVAQRNAVKLKSAIKATQGLLQIILDAAREGLKTTDCYTDPRKKVTMRSAYSPLCTPVAVNRTA